MRHGFCTPHLRYSGAVTPRKVGRSYEKWEGDDHHKSTQCGGGCAGSSGFLLPPPSHILCFLFFHLRGCTDAERRKKRAALFPTAPDFDTTAHVVVFDFRCCITRAANHVTASGVRGFLSPSHNFLVMHTKGPGVE